MKLDRPLDRSHPPASEGVRLFPFPEFESRRLANGLRLMTARIPGQPLVHIQVLLAAGGNRNAPGAAGLASLHAALLDEGTKSRSALEIAALVEGMGGFVGSAADWDTAYLVGELLATHAAEGLEILADILLGACFPEVEVDRLRQQRLAEILRRGQQPSSIAEEAFARGIFEGTIFAEPLIGTEVSLGELSREQCLAFHQRYCQPEDSSVVIVGDCDMDALAERCEAILGDWKTSEAAPRPEFQHAHLPQTQVLIMDRPGAAQTELRIGHLGVPRSHPGYPARLVLNTVLGGKFTSRLNLNLREKHGFTYGIQSHFVHRQGPAPFLIRSAVKTEVAGAAVKEVLSELHRIREEPIRDEELIGSREYLAGVFPYTLQSASDIARRLADLRIYDLPEDHYERYPAVLLEVTKEQGWEAARELLKPDHLLIVAAGPAEELGRQLGELGPVEIRST